MKYVRNRTGYQFTIGNLLCCILFYTVYGCATFSVDSIINLNGFYLLLSCCVALFTSGEHVGIITTFVVKIAIVILLLWNLLWNWSYCSPVLHYINSFNNNTKIYNIYILTFSIILMFLWSTSFWLVEQNILVSNFYIMKCWQKTARQVIRFWNRPVVNEFHMYSVRIASVFFFFFCSYISHMHPV